MVRINYTSWLADKVGEVEETLDVPENVHTISDLLDWLSEQSEAHKAAFRYKDVVYAAVNGSVVPQAAAFKDSEEITFFAPIAGG